MTNKIIELEAGKFGVKRLADDGSSLGLCIERFDTEAEAQAFADTLPSEAGQVGEQATAPKGAEGDKPDFIKHTVTQEDIELNPQLPEMGINAGDEIELPLPTEATAEQIAEAVKAYEAQKSNDGQA